MHSPAPTMRYKATICGDHGLGTTNEAFFQPYPTLLDQLGSRINCGVYLAKLLGAVHKRRRQWGGG